MTDLFQLGDPKGKRIVVAMSGGVDSSVVAALAAQSGAETIGITLRLYDDAATPRRAGSCCAGQDARDARAVADRLGIQHHVHDMASRFREDVIDRFADDYVAGRTPIPCVQCNMGVKFNDLLSLARELGADCLATGHYVRRIGSELHRAVDPARDQSYFLFQTTEAQLDYLRFPLGGMEKSDVRRLAAEAGLIVAGKPDSQDICFVPDGDYAGLVRKLRPEAARAGEIVDLNGRVLGQHGGIAGFTIGQRRGLEIGGLANPLYVVRLEAAANRVIVGPRSALAVDAASLSGINLIGPAPTEPLTVKVRSLAKPVPARLDGDRVTFAAPEYGVAPGQAAVLYAGTRCWGGGWIEETLASRREDGGMTRAFQLVDVFGKGPFTGNPLGVVAAAEGLSTEEMQAITRWLNLSETAFLLPPTDPGADYKVRIFTLAHELPFAGHPTLGSCHAWLAMGGSPKRADAVVQECGAGLVEVRRDGETLAFAAPPLIRGGEPREAEIAEVATVLGIDRKAIVAARWADNGPGWIAVMLGSAAEVLAIEAPKHAERRIDIGVVGLHEPGGDAAWEIRAIFSDGQGGLIEDPATGSLNASVGQWLFSAGYVQDSYIAAQGTRIARTARIAVSRDAEGQVWVGGKTLTLVNGTIDA